jgi:hypothetical protein
MTNSDMVSEQQITRGRVDKGVSPRARKRAVRRIARAYEHGRLHRDGFERRTARALTAGSRADLRVATRDLPHAWRPVARLRRTIRRATKRP